MAPNRKLFTVSKNRQELVNIENEASLIDSSEDVINICGSLLDIKSAGRYAKTCRTINNFFQPNLDKKAEPFVSKALHYAAFGKMKELDLLLTKRPGLIYKRGKTLDIANRTIHGSVYRIALGAKDWKPFRLERFEEMAEMIERHIKALPNGGDEIESQKAEQFPPGWQEQEIAREANDSAALREVFAAIEQQSENNELRIDTDCQAAYEKFIHYLNAQDEIQTGYHFNDKLLTEVKDLYHTNYKQFGGWTSLRNKIASVGIIGGIQARMPACLAMAYCHGLGKLMMNEEQLNRDLRLLNSSPFFSDNLGSSHYIQSCENGAASEETAGSFLHPYFEEKFIQLLEKKDAEANRKLQNLNNQNSLQHR